MPKMKTRRAAKKRYNLTASGKVKVQKSGLRHLLTHKSTGKKRNMRKAAYVHSTDMKNVRKCLPYG